jgi:hypothetical protein
MTNHLLKIQALGCHSDTGSKWQLAAAVSSQLHYSKESSITKKAVSIKEAAIFI